MHPLMVPTFVIEVRLSRQIAHVSSSSSSRMMGDSLVPFPKREFMVPIDAVRFECFAGVSVCSTLENGMKEM